jgi:hypothetical protein
MSHPLHARHRHARQSERAPALTLVLVSVRALVLSLVPVRALVLVLVRERLWLPARALLWLPMLVPVPVSVLAA